MKAVFKNFLFSKQILVGETGAKSEDAFSVVLALAKLFNIKIIRGSEYAALEHIRFVSEKLGENVPMPFYKGFPQSVLNLSFEQRLLDQLFHYVNTYGLGDFSESGHSIFEETFERTALKEAGTCKKFSIISEKEAVEKIEACVKDLLKSTRSLNNSAYQVVLSYMKDYGFTPGSCPCKDTAIRLLVDTRDDRYADFISFSDIIRLVEYINRTTYGSSNIKKLSFSNQNRKLIAVVMNRKLQKNECNIKECFEKQAVWCGLLHHIHFKPKNELGEKFVHAMREEKNRSVYSDFESAMADNHIGQALHCLKEGKGSGAVIRHLNYLLSRCKNQEDIDLVLENLHTKNPILLLQLYIQYINYNERSGRTFKFAKNNMLMVHKETPQEVRRRKSFVPKEIRARVVSVLYKNLEEICRNKLGSVYIDEDMKRIALPLQENTSMIGFGIMPKGSRIPLEKGEYIRGFTYWEKVDDIDLSVIGLTGDGKQIEFSWRTMAEESNPAIVYSGDEVSGYYGGAEYFDIDLELFENRYPEVRYLVFCNNVYSRIPFSKCKCKAGYMIREDMNSGEIFEPKTVASSFAINCDSTFAYLFGIDLELNELLWLNIGGSGAVYVAGNAFLDFLFDYFNLTYIINVYDLFALLAGSITTDPAAADVVVSDADVPVKEGADVVRSCDYEKIMGYLMDI